MKIVDALKNDDVQVSFKDRWIIFEDGKFQVYKQTTHIWSGESEDTAVEYLLNS